MASIKTQHFDGDTSFGRNVAIGGKTDIQGSLEIGHNLKVKGWLDAVNIKGPNKGLFADATALREAYPQPHDGWWALVGLALPAPIYSARGGEWVATGETGGNPTIDSAQYSEAVEQMHDDLMQVAGDVATNEADITTLKGQVSTFVTSLLTESNTRSQADQALQAGIETLRTDMGTAVNAEAAHRSESDAALQASIESERQQREGADAAMQSRIDAEAAQRSESDAALQGDIDVERQLREEADALLASATVPLLFVNYDELVTNDGSVNAGRAMVNTTLANVLSTLSVPTYANYRKLGVVVTFTNEDEEWEAWQWKRGQFTEAEGWEPFGGASVGNCYNVTAARATNGDSLPTSPATYDTKQSAIEYAIAKRAVGIGVQITFASSSTTWKTYQYIGLSAEPEALLNLENWIDVAGQSAGDEQVVNINYICKDISVATRYNLAEAIAALTALREQKNVDYVKAGMVITYKTAEGEWEAKQLIGGAADYTNPDAWKDFGGGGNNLTANDAPEDGGTEAFSTGGAYQRLITNFNEEVSGDGLTKTYQAVNAKGQPIGDPIEIPISQGGGGSTSVSSFRIVFENNPLYAAVGGDIKGRMAARSYSQEGEEIIYNKITRIEILDATTGIVLSTRNMTDENSSSSLTDYKFGLDFTGFFAGAGSREFAVRVTDQEGYVRSQNITVVAVDMTVEITKPLNECRVTAGSSMTNLDNFYRFEKNALKKDGGIDVVIELLWADEWRVLGESNVTDTFSKSITINPTDLFGGGERMTHGAYLMRIHGYAPNAKVGGNYVYNTIMCIDANQGGVPVVAIRFDAKNYDEELRGTVSLYDNAVLQVAAYTGSSVSGNTKVGVYANSEAISTQNMAVSQVYRINYQVQGFRKGDIIEFRAVGEYGVNRGCSPTINVVVAESAIDVILKDGAAFGYDFALRTNADADKTITDNGITMQVDGSNWRSNGFGEYCGERCLRIAENVTATIPYSPFSFANAESSGLALQFAFATNNIKDADAMLMHCYDPTMGTGFYVKGNVVGIYCNKGQGRNKREERKFKCGEKHTMSVVVEPSSIYHERGGVRYSNIKMFLDGEEVACLAYTPGQSAITQSQPIEFDGHDGDFYLYYIMAYQSYYTWAQAFNNYLAKQTDVTAMMAEFESEDVLNELGAPSLDKMKAKMMPYYVIVAPQSVFDEFDGDVDTSKKFYCTLYYFNPEYPCLNFKATDVQWRRQGTTSAKRPVKNDRFYLAASKGSTYNKSTKTGGTVVELLNPDNATEVGRKAIALAAKNYTLVRPDAIPVQTITVKVDYSDSSNANDCGVCDMMNATFRALGRDYQTPAQRAFDGTFSKGDMTVSGCVMDHSTKNHPIAAFRATDDTLTNAWFQAKGNWKEDKAEQVALGFQKTPGYNLGCKNYGDFVDYFGLKAGDEYNGETLDADETLDEIEARFRLEAAQTGSAIDPEKLYLLSLYCGRNYRFMKYVGGTWADQTGSMKQVDGQWVVEGTVLNPVTGFELISYQDFDWWQGVSSVADMMDMQAAMAPWVQKLKDGGKISASTFPAWTRYFECMIDDDQLQIDLALGKKVPYDLYRMLKFCDDCNMVEAVPGHGNRWEKVSDDDKMADWRNNLWKYASPHSVYAYTLFTDYLAATDQRSKNMQPMWFLEDGYSVTNGVYSADEAVRMYLNKVYDCDTCNGKDNDGGCTVDAENDPNKFTDDTYTNPYSGYGSTLFANTDITEWVYLDGTHSSNRQLSLRTVAAAMRTARGTVDGVEMTPFSPEGALHFFVEKRLKFWKKLISSYDGEHKYIEFTGSADNMYFYALQGLGLTALPQFIEQRWRFRDGYYQTGRFFSGVLSGRIACASNDAEIHIKAAKTGYFGIGHDASGNLDEAVFLEAGQEWSFTQFSHQESALLYIYQADRMSEIDLSEISLDGTFNFGVMTLVEKLKIGGESHRDISIGSYTALSTVMLGNLPFLRELDLRNTTATSVDASGCPRIESILAEGSQLTSCTLAETSPITTLHLPATMTELSFINIPNLTYPGGLTLEGKSNVQKLMVSGCPEMDTMALVGAVVEASNLRAIGLRGLDVTAGVDVLRRLKDARVYGLDEDGNDISGDKGTDGMGVRCSGLTGVWESPGLVDEDVFAGLAAYFPLLELHNSPCTTIKMDDTVAASANITNLDNGTGYDFGCAYEPSGHISRILSRRHRCLAKRTGDGEVTVCMLDDTNSNRYASGQAAVLTGEEGDVMMYEPHYWYKGVNDHINRKKYAVFSSDAVRPEQAESVRLTLGSVTVTAGKAVRIGGGYGTLSAAVADIPSYSCCTVMVSGYRQVRWPSVASAAYGAVLLDAENNVVKRMGATSDSGMRNGDYCFTLVPEGAVRIAFTIASDAPFDYVLLTKSSRVEAIEPDWVEHTECLTGVYEGVVRDDTLRSVSGVVSTSNTSRNDFEVYAANMGRGFQIVDYEMHKDVGNLFFAMYGERDSQGVCGPGTRTVGRASGASNATGMLDTRATATDNESPAISGSEYVNGQAYAQTTPERTAIGSPVCMGYENWHGSKGEVLGIDFNKTRNDRVWRSRMPDGTERQIQGLTSYSIYPKSMLHGRYMDLVASVAGGSVTSYYHDGFSHSDHVRGTVYRSGYNTYASGGVTFIASVAPDFVAEHIGTRLAFRGVIRFASSVSAFRGL